jgi:hypothetical protein
MHEIESYENNVKKYQKLINICKALEPYLQDKQKEEDMVNLAIDYIENDTEFNINDIITNYHERYRYTTILEPILKTNKYKLITHVYKRFNVLCNEDIECGINKAFNVGGVAFNLLTVLYGNLSYGGYTRDVTTELIFLFKHLEFLKEKSSIEQKLTTMDYLITQSQNTIYRCKDDFLLELKTKYQELLKEKEQKILSDFKLNIIKIKSKIEELSINLRHEPSEEILKLHKDYSDKEPA